MSVEPGLRERKKQRTRQAIAQAAFDLFADRGFDGVTVAEVARRAEVSEATVFNYFPTKEDLVYHRLEAFEEELLGAVRDRGPGQSVSAAFRDFLLGLRGLLASDDPAAAVRLAAFTRIVTGSPALLARERQIYDTYTRSLAGLVAEETSAGPDDTRPWVVANALIGVHRSLIEQVRRQVLNGRSGPSLARQVRAQVRCAFALLDDGIANYSARPAAD